MPRSDTASPRRSRSKGRAASPASPARRKAAASPSRKKSKSPLRKRATAPASPKPKGSPKDGPTSLKRSNSPKKTPAAKKHTSPYGVSADGWEIEYEFGGPIGAAAIILMSHFFLYYFWISIEFYGGALHRPNSLSSADLSEYAKRMYGHFLEKGLPTVFTFTLYSAFLLFEFALAVLLPIGVSVKGLKIPSENNRQITYFCNAYGCWVVLVATAAALHYTGTLPLQTLRQNFGSLMTVAVIFGNVFSVIIYVAGFFSKYPPIRMTGNHLYDFFIGSYLNPEILGVDLKMFAEIRNSWCLLFLLTCSCAATMHSDHGTVTLSMVFMIVAHWLYVNACQKGEQYIPSTWDIFYEKWGWMIIFWNFAGVPFLYCMQSLYIQTVLGASWSVPAPVFIVMICVLLFAYYVFDTANSQKNHFRLTRQAGEVQDRMCFPQLPWRKLDDPEVVGSGRLTLLVGGWWGYLRKPHYTADLTMSLLWGLSCGLQSFVPFFYFFFFLGHLSHRVTRDQNKCAEKYGEVWVQYTKRVPYTFIPGIF